MGHLDPSTTQRLEETTQIFDLDFTKLRNFWHKMVVFIFGSILIKHYKYNLNILAKKKTPNNLYFLQKHCCNNQNRKKMSYTNSRLKGKTAASGPKMKHGLLKIFKLPT